MAARKSAPKTITLKPVLDMNEATALHESLSAVRGQPVTIDASAVERTGTLCVQVLLAASRTWDNDKQPFTFSKVSDAFKKTTQLIGINFDHLAA
ncbi:chemotaxis protein CheX [Rhizobium sp. RU20A]|uniref:STAS domain-containing protein n=1 Tax=Rhizobium sp. RU20A TaxID=1907412 RepID=UPI000955B9EE|nr:STAS domain-containing protein [Rhizobium sp. RU20A]SIQ56856.1 chemotaxis protein CheX [Rhizobium sp. RU20A]